MAIHRSPLFEGARGSIRHQLVFRQIAGKTVVSKFPDRSKVIYSEAQRAAQRRFADAVSFARVVIKDPGLKRIYSVKAAVLRYRSAWNVAIAEFMGKLPLQVKRRKTVIKLALDKEFTGIRLYKLDEVQDVVVHVSSIQRKRESGREIRETRRDARPGILGDRMRVLPTASLSVKSQRRRD